MEERLNNVLTIEHLAAHLPYGVKLYGFGCDWQLTGLTVDGAILFDGTNSADLFPFREVEHNFRLALRPLSDLTKDNMYIKELFIEFGGGYKDLDSFEENAIPNYTWNPIQTLNYNQIQKLLEWHFDIHGLIDAGLAVDINQVNR